MENNLNWSGWRNIEISNELIGDTVEKGSGYWKKEYTYINIPTGYGYDGYIFLLSNNCVHDNFGNEHLWFSYFSICHDMKIELIYNPEFLQVIRI